MNKPTLIEVVKYCFGKDAVLSVALILYEMDGNNTRDLARLVSEGPSPLYNRWKLCIKQAENLLEIKPATDEILNILGDH